MLIFSERLKKLRTRYNRTQSDIASALEMTTQNYSAYEKGREPPYEVLVRVAKYFGVSTDFLLGLSDFDSYDTEVLDKEIIISIEPYKKEINLFKLLPEVMELPSFVEFFKAIYIYITAPDREFRSPAQEFTVSSEYGIRSSFRINERAREITLTPFVINLLNDMQYEYIRNIRKENLTKDINLQEGEE